MGLLLAALRWLLPLALRAALPGWLGERVLWVLGVFCLLTMFVHSKVDEGAGAYNCGVGLLQATALGLIVSWLLEAPLGAASGDDGSGPSLAPSWEMLACGACAVGALLVLLQDRCGCAASAANTSVACAADIWQRVERQLDPARAHYPGYAAVKAVCALLFRCLAVNYERTCAVACALAT